MGAKFTHMCQLASTSGHLLLCWTARLLGCLPVRRHVQWQQGKAGMAGMAGIMIQLKPYRPLLATQHACGACQCARMCNGSMAEAGMAGMTP